MNKTNGNKVEGGSSEDAPKAGPGFVSECLHQLKISILATIVLGIIVSAVYPVVVWGLAQGLFHDKANGSLIGKDGKPVSKDEDAVGSSLIGQSFSDAKYFHPRPSSAGGGYDATASSGSNLGPTSAKLINGTTKPTTLPATQPGGDPLPGPDAVDFDGVQDRIVHYCDENHLDYVSSMPLKDFRDAQGNLDDVKLIKAFNADTPLVFTSKDPIPADAVTASGSGLDPHIGVANAQIQAGRVAEARKISVDKVKALIAENTDAPQLGILGQAGVNVLRLNLALDQVAPVAPPTPAPTTLPATEPAVKAP
jgi:K+-transporting ATPase ATPase C chain